MSGQLWLRGGAGILLSEGRGFDSLVCMSKCSWARYWSSCAGWHFAWQPTPSAYLCITVCRFGQKLLINHVNVSGKKTLTLNVKTGKQQRVDNIIQMNKPKKYLKRNYFSVYLSSHCAHVNVTKSERLETLRKRAMGGESDYYLNSISKSSCSLKSTRLCVLMTLSSWHWLCAHPRD